MNRSLATSIPSPRRRPPSSTVAPYLRIVLLFLNLCIKVFPHLFLQRCTLMHIILLADADEIDLYFLIVHRGKRCSKIYFVDFPPSSLSPRFDINHRRFAYLSRRSRKNRFRVYIFWTMACIFLEESFFSRNSCGLARELREYNNSRGWPYLLPRNGAPKNRPHRGVNINACCRGRDAV